MRYSLESHNINQSLCVRRAAAHEAGALILFPAVVTGLQRGADLSTLTSGSTQGEPHVETIWIGTRVSSARICTNQ